MDGYCVTFDHVLGRLVAGLRYMLGESQTSFARRSRMHPRTLSRIESGTTAASALHLVLMDRALAEAFAHFERGDLVDCVEAALFDIAHAGGRVVRKYDPKTGLVPLPEPMLNSLVLRVAEEEAREARRVAEEDGALTDIYEEV